MKNIKVLSFNILNGGRNFINQITSTIHNINPSIVLLQESNGNIPIICDILKHKYNWDNMNYDESSHT